MEMETVVATCCESVPNGCTENFPAVCTHMCAELAVPIFDECLLMIGQMPDSVFTSFKLSKFSIFTDACRQTQVLFERGAATGSCGGADDAASAALKARVNTLNSVCCEQDGQNSCADQGSPQTCDAGVAVCIHVG